MGVDRHVAHPEAEQQDAGRGLATDAGQRREQRARLLDAHLGQLVERHGGKVPAEMDALTALPGVGRKTANVVLGHALGVPGLPVDRHVLRVANRIGIAEGDDPEKVEAQLCSVLPPDRWTRASDVLILHGRRVCRPKPLCPSCSVQQYCLYFRTGAATDDRLADRPTGARKAAAVAKKARHGAAKKPGRARSSARRRSR
jgi:adenine-specific DNA glycosylase